MDGNNRLVELFCDDGDYEYPYLGGEPMGQNRYVIKDIYWDMLSCGNPLGIGLEDVVEAQPNEHGNLAVTQIISKSGYATLRMMTTARSTAVLDEWSGEEAIKFRNYLEQNGCTSMVSMASYWLVHTPPGFNSQEILDYIQAEAIPLQEYCI
jgi:hypothetical protein